MTTSEPLDSLAWKVQAFDRFPEENASRLAATLLEWSMPQYGEDE